MMGTDFWVTFCSNANRGVGEYFFYVIAPRQCVVTVANGFDNNPMLFSVDTVPAESLVCIPLPHYFVFHVTSTDSITLYASNFTEASWDITTVLPTHALRKHYIVQTYSDHSLPDREPEFRFITTEFHNHDTIIIKHYNEDDAGYNPTVTTHVGYRENRPYTQQYHCYGGWSLSGTELHSEYPIAVFQGNECARVPSGFPACDHLYEQARPIDYWGTDYLLVPTAERGYRPIIGFDADSNIIWGDIYSPGNGDMVMVTSSADDCILWLDGTPIDTLLRGQTAQFFIPSDTCRRLVASHPVAAYLYLCGGSFSGEYGDPAVVFVPPLEQGVATSYFASINTNRTRCHFANIVVHTRDVPFMTLDNVSIAGDFIPFDTLYSYARLSVAGGMHILECTNGARFVAHLYGLGDDESYAYVAGMSLNDLSHLYVTGNVRQRVADGVRACIGDTLLFQITTTLHDTVTQWFVDRMPYPGNHTLSFPYIFYGSGTHQISAIVHGQQCDTLRTNVYISPMYADTIFASFCRKGSYIWHDSVITDSGFYRFLTTGSIGCDSISHLNLSIADTYTIDYYDSICANASYSWQGRTISDEGLYVDTITSADGCDTITSLHLSVIPLNQAVIFDTACLSTTYFWNGHSFTTEGVYIDTVASSNGCDSITNLHLYFIPLNRSDIYDTACLSTPYSWNGHSFTSEGTYVDTIAANEGCDTIATLHLSAIHSPDVTIDVLSDCNGYYLYANTDAPFFEWSSEPFDAQLAGQSTSANIRVSPDSTSITYTLIADYDIDYLCPASESVTLTPIHPIIADFSVVPSVLTTDNLDYRLVDKSIGATSISWFVNGEWVGDSSQLSLTADPVSDSLIIMLVATNGLCSDTAYSSLPIRRVTLWVPNVFTPGKQTNRVFAPVGEGIISGELYIFNRQGLLVAYQPDYRQGWDGTYNPPVSNPGTGNTTYLCPQASYVWLLIYRTIDAPSLSRQAKGTVTLLR